MQISLHSPLRKVLFAGGCLVMVSFYLFFAIRSYRAYRLAEMGNFESAIKLEPGNADYHQQFGQLQLFTDPRTQHSIESLTRSVALNPYSARTWLALASAHQVHGDSEQQRKAILQAVSMDATTPEIAWEAAIFFVARGEVDPALRYLRVVSEYDSPTLALDAAWRLTHDPEKILHSSMPETVAAHTQFLRLMVANNQPAGAEKTWAHLMQMRQSFDPKLVFFYFDYLVQRQDGAAARNAWRDLVGLIPALSNYNNLTNSIVNADFEEELLNGGLDWQFKTTSGTSLALDTSNFYSGARSLAITYKGESNFDSGVSQFIPVEPNSRYQLTAYTKGDQISSANGPYLTVSDARTSIQIAKTEEFTGSYPWKPASLEFQIGPDTSVVVLAINRNPSSTRIRGKLWLDNLSLIPK